MSATPKSQKLAREISKALARSHCTFGEMWFAFSVNLSFLLADLSPESRMQGYVDLTKRIEDMIAGSKADGVKGADIPKRGH